MRSYTTRNAHAADANGKPRLIKIGLRSVETLLQCWHLYSTVIIGCTLKKIVRDVEANVAASQHGQRNQDRRDRLNGEAASTKTLRHFLTSPIDPCLSFATGIFR
jgi:hypothetical protein